MLFYYMNKIYSLLILTFSMVLLGCSSTPYKSFDDYSFAYNENSFQLVKDDSLEILAILDTNGEILSLSITDKTGKEIIVNMYEDSFASYMLKTKETYEMKTNIYETSEVLLLREERFDNMRILYEILEDGTIRTLEVDHNDETVKIQREVEKMFNNVKIE